MLGSELKDCGTQGSCCSIEKLRRAGLCRKPDREGGPLPKEALPHGRASDTGFVDRVTWFRREPSTKIKNYCELLSEDDLLAPLWQNSCTG